MLGGIMFAEDLDDEPAAGEDLELGRKGMDIVGNNNNGSRSPRGGRGHKKSASHSMSTSLQRYLSELASLQEKEIKYTDQKFKSHVGSYRLVKNIGQGSGGEVFLARHDKTGEKVAIKIVRKSQSHPQWERMARQENSIMQYLARFPKDNKRIIKHIMTMENDKEIGIVMQYAQGGDLFELVKRRKILPETEAWRIFKQLIQAVKFIHGKRLCHRDIQPCNVFLDKDNNVLVGDWGHSKTWTPYEKSQENCGSLCYAAPEVFLADKEYVGPEIDLWSCGTVLYLMLAGQRPFWSNNTTDIYENIRAGRYKKLPENLSPEVSHLLSILLSTDPLKRATMLDVLNHPWMKNYPTRVKRSDSSPLLLPPRVPTHLSPTACEAKFGSLGRKQPHPLLIARKSKGVSCEQLDLTGFRANPTSSLVVISERLAREKRQQQLLNLGLAEKNINSLNPSHHNHHNNDNEDNNVAEEGCGGDGKTKRPKDDACYLAEEDVFDLESPPSESASSVKINGLLHNMISSGLTPCNGQMSCEEPLLTPAEY